jgi:hypothetical protein
VTSHHHRANPPGATTPASPPARAGKDEPDDNADQQKYKKGYEAWRKMKLGT